MKLGTHKPVPNETSAPNKDKDLEIGNFTSQDFGIRLHSFGADSSSPQLSEIFVGHFTRGK